MSGNFSQLLAFFNRGELNDELSAEMTELVKMVRLTGKQGSISLTIKIAKANKRDEDTIKVTPQFKTTLPQLDQAEMIMFSTHDGDILRNDPRQSEINLKEVSTQNEQNYKEAH